MNKKNAKKTVFVFVGESIRKYSVSEGQGAELAGECAVKDLEKAPEGFLPDAGSGTADLELYLSRGIVLEDECGVPGGSTPVEREKACFARLIENPLFSSAEHAYVFIPGDVLPEGPFEKQLLSIYFFERKWLTLMQDLFIRRGAIPSKAGILCSSFCPAVDSGSGKPVVVIEWNRDLEINLFCGKALCYSRHVPLPAENEAAEEIKETIKRLGRYFPSLSQDIYILSPFDVTRKIGREMQESGITYAVKDCDSSPAGRSLKEKMAADPLIAAVISGAGCGRELISIAGRMTVGASDAVPSLKLVRAVAGIFFFLGLLAVILAEIMSGRIHNRMAADMKKYLGMTEGVKKPYADIFSSFEKAFSWGSTYQEKPCSLIYSSLAFCIPRDARWELLSLRKDGRKYEAAISFSDEKDTGGFLKAAKQITAWKLLPGEKSDGKTVTLSFEVAHEQ